MSSKNPGTHFALLKTYSSVAVPVELLPMILKECYIVETSYNSTSARSEVSKVKKLESADFIDAEEINSVLATQRLCE